MPHSPSLIRWAACSALLLSAACHRNIAHQAAEPLEGLELPLWTSGGVRIAVEGELDGEPVQTAFEVSQPMTSATEACFAETPRSSVEVELAQPEGGALRAPEITLTGLRIGGRAIGSRPAYLVAADAEEEQECVVTLGSDVLAPYALTVDPSTRTLRITTSQPKSAYVEQMSSQEAAASGREHHLIELIRDPRSDWPLLALRLKQGAAQLTGPFVMSTSRSESWLAQPVAKDAKLQLGPDFLRELGFPAHIELPKALLGDVYALERLELSPGFGFRFAGVRDAPEWKNDSVIGILGGDVWGRFIATIDAKAGVLWLRRPRVFASGDRQRCAVGGGVRDEESCFVLEQSNQESGVELVATVWRDLPEGARLYLDLLDEKNEPLTGGCQVGLTFSSVDRGVTAAHQVPWASLRERMPECHAQFSKAQSVRFSLWQEGMLDECSGNCAFVIDAMRGMVSCECSSVSGTRFGEAERRFMEMFREMMRRKIKTAPKRDEPEDPAP